MTPTELAIAGKFPGEVQVNIHYAGFSDLLDSFDDFPGDYRTALINTITDHGVFEASSPATGHRLDVIISEVHAPGMGLSMTVRIATLWQLTSPGETEPFLTESILGEHTTPAGAHFVGMIRVQMAAVGAAKDTIRQGVEAISRAATGMPHAQDGPVRGRG